MTYLYRNRSLRAGFAALLIAAGSAAAPAAAESGPPAPPPPASAAPPPAPAAAPPLPGPPGGPPPHPGPRGPRRGLGIVGTIVAARPYAAELRTPDGRTLHLKLHAGTVIDPRGTTLAPGMQVAVRGVPQTGATILTDGIRALPPPAPPGRPPAPPRSRPGGPGPVDEPR